MNVCIFPFHQNYALNYHTLKFLWFIADTDISCYKIKKSHVKFYVRLFMHFCLEWCTTANMYVIWLLDLLVHIFSSHWAGDCFSLLEFFSTFPYVPYENTNW